MRADTRKYYTSSFFYPDTDRVWAFKINTVVPRPCGGAMLIPKTETQIVTKVSYNYMINYQPKVGDYYVMDKHGKQLFSQAKTFEDKHIKLN